MWPEIVDFAAIDGIVSGFGVEEFDQKQPIRIIKLVDSQIKLGK